MLADFFGFQFDIEKYQGKDTQNYNFTYRFYGCETWSLTLGGET
jgi:hypothetical protein